MKLKTQEDKNGKNNMATLKESAQKFKSSKTLNISDLAKVSADVELIEDSFELEDNVTHETKTINQEVIIVDDVKYRVPTSVKAQLKILLEDNPNLKYFKVKRSGTGISDTKYQVIPLME